MLLRPTKSIRATLFLPQIIAKDGNSLSIPTPGSPQQQQDFSPLPVVHSSGWISPAILFIIVIVAIIFFIASLLHLIVCFLARKQSRRRRLRPPGGGGDAMAGPTDVLGCRPRQLFHLHDAGLGQAFIKPSPSSPTATSLTVPTSPSTALSASASSPLMTGSASSRSAATHSTSAALTLGCPRTPPACYAVVVSVPGLVIENPIFEFDGESDEERPSSWFPVRLGKFMNLSNPNGSTDEGEITVTGESSSSQLDARWCYSMGSYEYVVADASLQVELPKVNKKSGDSKGVRGSGEAAVDEGKRLGIGSRGESFSVSKIWLWLNTKGKHPISSDASTLDGGLPWMKQRTSVGDS